MNLQDTFEIDNLQGAPKIILETPSGSENTIRSIDEGIPEETETEIDESQVMIFFSFIIFHQKTVKQIGRQRPTTKMQD